MPTPETSHQENLLYQRTITPNLKNLACIGPSPHGTAFPPAYQKQPSKFTKPDTRTI